MNDIKPLRSTYHRYCRSGAVCALLIASTAGAMGQQRAYPVAPPQYEEQQAGPYNIHVLQGGAELLRPLPAATRMILPDASFVLSLWVQLTSDTERTTLLAGVGNPMEEDSRFLGLENGRLVLRTGKGIAIGAGAPLTPVGWHMLTAIVEGPQARLYADGVLVGEGHILQGRLAPQLVIAPADGEGKQLHREGYEHFGGYLAGVTLDPDVANAEAKMHVPQQAPDTSLFRYEEASPQWPVQVRGQAGYTQQQDPSLLPVSRGAPAKPDAKALAPLSASALAAAGRSRWILNANWFLTNAPTVTAAPEEIAKAGFSTRNWMRATVPGTVLTTMVDRGVYADPDIGLNNLQIPESLAHQDYWYRVEFPTPGAAEKHFTLTFEGVNYVAEAWLNGKRLGAIKGAFVRGQFDVSTSLNRRGVNALAVRVSPAPHPGIPQEQSMKGGPGENGGSMVMDGPTFSATEGWDWIPAIRDRNTGIWQDVILSAENEVRLGDPQVITKLPLPDRSSADVSIAVPLRNTGGAAVKAVVRASFEGVELAKSVQIPPGASTVRFTPAEFPQLRVGHPRLWWPNGYGAAELYRLHVAVMVGAAESDRRELTFGIREVTYELSLFDKSGHLRRVEVSPTEAMRLHQQVVDVRHEGLRKRQAEFSAASLTEAGETSKAVTPLKNDDDLTDLVLKVNGVRIAARGGNWGMDDSRKRVSRERLEPYFRLHKEAHLNIVRNWMGQDTEEMFYQLADEYGLMVWNDFWESTQDYNIEAQDVPLFLENALDTVRRFRNHPSIVMWCGRNEGVPQPILNEGLIGLLQEEDGTRYYTPDSNRVNLRNSGPYSYRSPATYYSIDKGFSVELGTSSLSTLESLQASIAPEDQWPISDAWAYHDWHWAGNGDIHPFLAAIDQQLGAGDSLKDFERKAQMFNYVNHRAIFEGFNQHLWTPNSGRLLWMTQPAWPSNMWQIFSSDLDTNASYYGVKKACEPLHVQLDLSSFAVAAINTTGDDAGAVKVHAAVYSLAHKLLLEQDGTADLKADAAYPLFTLPLGPLFGSEGLVLVELTMTGSGGGVLSNNTYWLAADDTQYRKLNALGAATLTTSATEHVDRDESVVELHIGNSGSVPALQVKATPTLQGGGRVLPAYFSDNYVNLLPGESATIVIRSPLRRPGQGLVIGLRGWNLKEFEVKVSPT